MGLGAEARLGPTRGAFSARVGVAGAPRGGLGVARPARTNPAPTVLLIAPSPAEEAQARHWRPIARRWPSQALPQVRLVPWEEAAGEGFEASGDVALVLGRPSTTQSEIFRVLDRLAQALVPSVVVDPRAGVAGAFTTATISVTPDHDPGAVAAMLYALASRQPAVESLRMEVGVARRFQGGLRGEIDKIHEELQLAASVQREFLPRTLPRMPNIDLRVLFRPCGYVSGDIYDVQKLDDEHMGFFIADAVGHGVPAALMTMVLCRCLTTTRTEGDETVILSPSEVLRSLNQEMIRRHGDTPRFATAVYGVVNCTTRRVTIAGAGHPHPLILKGSSISRIETDGGLLGIFPEDRFEETSFTLREDELMVVFSDGFETAFPSPTADPYGRRLPTMHYVERFVELSERWGNENLSAAIRVLTEQIDQQSGSLHQVDDLTALVLAPMVDSPLDHLFAGSDDTASGESRPRDTPAHEPKRAPDPARGG